MKLPLIQKIEINQFDLEFLRMVVKKNTCGHIPTVILFQPVKDMGLQIPINNLQQVFLELDINPLFPYPTYLLREPGIEQNFFPEIDHIEDVPRHFIKRIKRMKKREQILHGKTVTLSERIANHSVNRDLDYMDQKTAMNKMLRDHYMEKRFYFDLLQKIKGNTEEEKV